MMYREASEELLSFIKKSPSCFHAVATISEQLKAEGFQELKECEASVSYTHLTLPTNSLV